MSNQQKADESIEVSYTILRAVNQRNRDEILQKIVTAINVQLALENSQSIPFISSNGFDTVKLQDKLFIYGLSGCGKSRCIYELAKDKLDDVENIFIINPRQTLGEESGRISIHELAIKLNQKDIVIWDNFPDDLLKRDVESAGEVLEIISVRGVTNLLVALKPKYLEIYRGVAKKVPELYDYEIGYDRQKISSIITSYGKNIIPFIDVYEKYVSPNIHQISTILWQKEPLPITILTYFRELVRKQNEMKGESIDTILEAQKLMHRTDYYKHQFALISNLEDRQNDIDFLYTLRLCYELSLSRAPTLIHQLQKGIFDSVPSKEPTRKLSIWIYLSGRYYSMHDAPGEAIEFPKDVKLKMINYLAENFSKVIGKEDNQIYSFGIFFGRNIDLIAYDTSHNFLPAHIYDYMKNKRYFELGLGQGAGETFSSLDYHIQEQILRRVEIDGEFASGLGYGLGSSFLSLDKERQIHILEVIIRKSIPFARGLGESLGHKFTSMSQEIKEEVFKALLIKENFQFARGLGMGLGLAFLQLDIKVQKKIFDFTTQNYQFAVGVGSGLGNIFTSLPKEFQDEVFDRAEKNGYLTRGLGIGLGNIFTSLPKQFQHEVFDRAEKDIEFAYGLGYQMGYNFNLIDKELQKEVFMKIDENSEFASGISLGLGAAFTHLSEELQKKLFTVTEKNIQFAYGVGNGFGFTFKYLPRELRLDIFARIEHNSEFAKGLGFGLGCTFSYLDNDFQKDAFAKIEENSQFACGLGEGIGLIYEHMPANLQEEIFKKAEKNNQFTRGLGEGFGYSLNILNEKLQYDIFRLTEENSEFAVGLGIGLRYSFPYLSTEFQEKMNSKANQNIQFAYGLGIGLGSVFVYLKGSLKNNLFEMAERNEQFVVGLGVGLSNLFTFVDEDFQEEIFKRAEKNSKFMKGLGIGLGKVFPFIDKECQSKLFVLAQKEAEFAIGLGEGFGEIFAYLKKELRDKILGDLGKERTNENDDARNIQDHDFRRNGSGFDRGLGIGLGKNFVNIRKDFEFRIFAKALINIQFAIGLGEGLGRVFSYLDNELSNRILRKSNEYPLARGLGIGLSDIFYYLIYNEELQDKIFRETDRNRVLAKSLGASLNYHFLWSKDHNLFRKTLSKAEENLGFAEGIRMKEDSYNDNRYLNKESQDRLIDICREVDKKCGYNKNFSFNDYPKTGFPTNTYYYCTNKENQIDDTNVIDDEMKDYLQMVLDEVKSQSEKDRTNNL
jgi:hypothetical protein